MCVQRYGTQVETSRSDSKSQPSGSSQSSAPDTATTSERALGSQGAIKRVVFAGDVSLIEFERLDDIVRTRSDGTACPTLRHPSDDPVFDDRSTVEQAVEALIRFVDSAATATATATATAAAGEGEWDEEAQTLATGSMTSDGAFLRDGRPSSRSV